MKKRLICMLTLLCICIASLASAVMVYADGETSPFTATWTHVSGDIAGMKYSADENGTTTILIESLPTGKNRAYFEVTGHTLVEYPKVKVVYSSTKAFAMYLSINGTGSSDQLEYYTLQASGTEVAKVYDLPNGDVTKIYLSIDRPGNGDYDESTYADGGKVITFDFYFIDANGNDVKIPCTGANYIASHTHEWDTNLTQGESTHWYKCLAGCDEKQGEEAHDYSNGSCVCGKEKPAELTFGEPSVVDGDATLADGVFTFSANKSIISVPVTNCTPDAIKYFSMQYVASGISAIELSVTGLDATGAEAQVYVAGHNGWNIVNEENEGNTIKNAKINSYFADWTSVSSILIVCTPEAEGATIKFFDFAATTDSVHGFDPNVSAGGSEEPEQPEEPGEMTIGDLVAPESSDSVTYTASKDATTGYQTITVLGTSSWNYYSLTISNLEAGKDTLYLVFENDADVELFYKVNGTENWTIGYVTYKAGLNSQAIPVTANAEGHVVIEFCIEAGKTVDPVKTVVFTSIGFEAPQLPEVEKPAIEDITTSADVAITKDETTGYQTLTYSVSPGWHELKIVINEFDSSKTYAKVTFEHQNNDPINLFYIVNGNENHDIGWKAYGKGESVEYIPLSGLELATPWTFAFFLDSNETLTGEKVVVFKALEFVTEDDLPKAPEGLHFTASTEGGITCVTNENGGWDVSWNNDSASWRNVSLNINNYEVAYDILKLSISATAGTNIGIRWHYVVVDEDGETPLHARVRTHDAYEGIVGETGTLELVYLAKAYNMQGLMQTKVEIWFDCPTGTSTNVGAQSATINSVELLKSSEITFEALAITAEAMSVDFTGEAISFVATSAPAVALVTEYEVLDSTGKMVWTKSAPSKAGTYNVRVMFMGSLKHDYTVVTSTLTINKVKAVTNESDVTIDPETRIVTVEDGVIASLAEDFAEGYEVISGDEIAYGSVIYYYRAADDNHTQGTVLSLTFNRPVVEDSSSETSSPETSAPATSDSEPKHEAPKKGCFGSVAAMGAEASILMMGAIAMFIRRKRK